MSTADYLMQMFGLDGRTAVVIGGTGVLGGAFSDALGFAGAHVVVVGRNAEHGEAAVHRISEAGGSAEFFAGDATSRDDLTALVDHLNTERAGIARSGQRGRHQFRHAVSGNHR